MYYYKHQYSNDLWPLKIKRNCILLINRSKLLIKLIIKNAVGLILDNFGIVGFLFFSPIPVDSSHISLHFDNILSPKAPIYFILNVLKRSLILAYGPTGGVSVLNITLLVGGNAGGRLFKGRCFGLCISARLFISKLQRSKLLSFRTRSLHEEIFPNS